MNSRKIRCFEKEDTLIGTRVLLREGTPFSLRWVGNDAIFPIALHQKEKKRYLQGKLDEKNQLKIVSVVKKIYRKHHLFSSGRYISHDRMILLNRKRVGTLKELSDFQKWRDKKGLRRLSKKRITHLVLKKWDVLMFSENGQIRIFYRGSLFALATPTSQGDFECKIKDEGYLLLCLSILIASLDSPFSESRYPSLW
ncbi:MAG: hypothetical protein J5736_04715 [Bacilli bacterium]|nr:hypothetical protein [Bacilli bacterium]